MDPVYKTGFDFLPLPQDPYFQSLFLESEDDCSSMGQVYFDEIPLVPPNALELHIDEPSELTNLEMQPETSNYRTRWSLKIEEIALSTFRKTKNLEDCAKLLKEKHEFQCTAKEIQEHFTDLGIDMEKTYDPLSKEEIKKLVKEVEKPRVPWSRLMIDFKRSPRSLKCQYDRYCKRDVEESQVSRTKNASKYDSLPDTKIRWSSKIEEVALAIFKKTKDLERCAIGLKDKFKLQFTENEIQKHFTDLGIDMEKSYEPLSKEQIENLIKQVKERGKCWSKLMLEFKRSPRYLRYLYKRHCIGITRSNLVTKKQTSSEKTDIPLQTRVDLVKKKAGVVNIAPAPIKQALSKKTDVAPQTCAQLAKKKIGPTNPVNIAPKRTFGQSVNLSEIRRLNQSVDHSEIRKINQSLINLVNKHNSNWEQIAIELSQEYQKTFTKESCYSLWLELDPKKKSTSLNTSELFALANLRVIFNDDIPLISQLLGRSPSLIQTYLR